MPLLICHAKCIMSMLAVCPPLSLSLWLSVCLLLCLSLSLSRSLCSFLLPSAFAAPSKPSTEVFQKHAVRHAVHLHRVRHRCWSVPSSVLQWLRLQELVRSLGEPCIMKSCETCPASNEFRRTLPPAVLALCCEAGAPSFDRVLHLLVPRLLPSACADDHGPRLLEDPSPGLVAPRRG